MTKKILKKILLSFAFMFSIYINAQNATFNNAGGDNLWSNVANWDTGSLPNGVATINTDVVVDGDFTITKLETSNGVDTNITVSGSNTLTLTGTTATYFHNKLNGILTIDCKIDIQVVNKNLDARFLDNNKIIFGPNSSVNLIESTKIRNFSQNPLEFSGVLMGSKNITISNATGNAQAGAITFTNTANNSKFTGIFIDFTEDIVSNIQSPNVFATSESTIQFSGIGGSLTLNGENTMLGSISRMGENNGVPAINFNTNQNNMQALNVIGTSAGNALVLNIGASVNELSFSSLSLNTGATDGILNIVGFKDDVLKFGSTLSQDQLNAIQIDGIATAGFLSQRENGYITKTTTLSLDSNILENTSIYPNPATNNLFINSPVNSSINLFNILGKNVKSVINTSGNLKLNTSDLSKGIYLVKINSENKTKTSKLLIN